MSNSTSRVRNLWADLETQFMARFNAHDNQDVHAHVEEVKDFVERSRNLSLRCPEGMPLYMLL